MPQVSRLHCQALAEGLTEGWETVEQSSGGNQSMYSISAGVPRTMPVDVVEWSRWIIRIGVRQIPGRRCCHPGIPPAAFS
jgi:hypothetical protein